MIFGHSISRFLMSGKEFVSLPGANTMKILRKSIYFLCKSKYFPIYFKAIFGFLEFYVKIRRFYIKMCFIVLAPEVRIPVYHCLSFFEKRDVDRQQQWPSKLGICRKFQMSINFVFFLQNW